MLRHKLQMDDESGFVDRAVDRVSYTNHLKTRYLLLTRLVYNPTEPRSSVPLSFRT